jgi:hypothetical protein
MTTDAMHGNLPQKVTLYPTGLGRADLHRWKTEPMTRELMDEIIRVRTKMAALTSENIPIIVRNKTVSRYRR